MLLARCRLFIFRCALTHTHHATPCCCATAGFYKGPGGHKHGPGGLPAHHLSTHPWYRAGWRLHSAAGMLQSRHRTPVLASAPLPRPWPGGRCDRQPGNQGQGQCSSRGLMRSLTSLFCCWPTLSTPSPLVLNNLDWSQVS